MGSVDGEGFPEKTQQHLDQGTLAEWATLTMMWRVETPDRQGPLGNVWLDAELVLNEGTAREISLGPLIGMYSYSSADGAKDAIEWQQITVDVKTDDLRYPDDPGCATEGELRRAGATATDAGIDADGDGLFDSMTVGLGMNVDVAATYYVFGSLTDGSGTEIESVRMKTILDVGAQTVPLSFNGSKLRSLGLDGPYTLADIALTESDTGIRLGSAGAAHTTTAYLYSDFQRPATTLTGTTSDAGVDWYGDASYERLLVEVEVDVLWEGDYRWSANLFSQDGRFIAGAGGRRTLSAGAALLNFEFDGWHIVQAGRNGPYELRLLAVGARNLMAATTTASKAGAAALVLEPSASLLASETIATTQPYTLADFGGPLPVELATFEAVADGNGTLLTWSTLSETNNAGFEIEGQQPLSADAAQPYWQVLAYVEGHGTTMEVQTYAYRANALGPGLHWFRLKQIDHDGTFAYSPEVETDLEVPGTHVLSAAHPNPFNPQTTVTLAVRTAQHVHIAVYDALGRRVALLHDSLLEAGETHSFAFDGTGRGSGLYLVRISGEQFQDVQRVTLVR